LAERLGDKLELLLAESLRVAHESGALRSQDLKRVTIDTTVQPKNVSFPTDAKLRLKCYRERSATPQYKR
jgi:IS5 family transposase